MEEALRNRIALMREMLADETDVTAAKEQEGKLLELERELEAFEKNGEFKKVSDEYWSHNGVQLSVMSMILQELGIEMAKLAGLSGEKGKKANELEELEKRKKDFSGDIDGILAFVPVGARTGWLVRQVSEDWEKAKGARDRIAFIKTLISEGEGVSLAISRKLELERKKLPSDRSGWSGGTETESRKAGITKLTDDSSRVMGNIKRRNQLLYELQGSLLDLNEKFQKDVRELARISAESKMSEEAGKTLKEVALTYSLPQVRLMVRRAAEAIPRDVLLKLQEVAIERYDELRGKFERVVTKAKSRSRCNRCREAIDSLMNGAIDHDAPEVRMCAKALEDGDIFEARRELNRAFENGKMHEYVRAELDGMMKELLILYDEKGEVSSAEEKVRKAGSLLFRSRLDLMRLDYILGGVHSAGEFWKAASETLRWLEGIGMMFGDDVDKEMEDMTGKPEFIANFNSSGFTKEQIENAKALAEFLSSEAKLLEQMGGSDAAREIFELEKKMASAVAASENFENSLFLKSVLTGDENANSMLGRMFENAGERKEELTLYLEAAVRKEALSKLKSDVESSANALSRVSVLCDDVGKMKNAISKSKTSETVSQKLALGKKIKELEDVLGGIVGENLDDELIAKIAEPKLGGAKLYNEITRSRSVRKAIAALIEHEGEALGVLIAGEKEEGEELSTPFKANAG